MCFSNMQCLIQLWVREAPASHDWPRAAASTGIPCYQFFWCSTLAKEQTKHDQSHQRSKILSLCGTPKKSNAFLKQDYLSAAEDCVDLDDYTEASLRKMAGNGMNIPCAGFVMLMGVLAVTNVQ